MNNIMMLFDILSFDERLIVLSNKGDGVIYTWNRSLTLQCWSKFRFDINPMYDVWEEIDVRTLSDEPKSFEEAQMKAREWQGTRWA